MDALEGHVRSVVREGVRWRRDIGEIIPGGLDVGLDGEDEGEAESEGDGQKISPAKNRVNKNAYGDIDLQLLLKLGSRIGRHSTANGVHNRSTTSVKRKRAQQLSQQSQQSQQEQTHLPNGDLATIDPAANPPQSLPSQQQTESQVSLPPESQQTLTLLEQAVISEREARSLAWPEASILRTGALGQLQLLRETDDNGVDGLVERMLREEAEAVGGFVGGDDSGRIKDEDDVVEDAPGASEAAATADISAAGAGTGTGTEKPAVEADAGIGSRTRRRSSVAVGGRPAAGQQQQQQRTKVKLDLYDEDDDEDDE